MAARKLTPREAAIQEQRKARERFRLARIAEREYGMQLASVGRQVGHLIRGYQKEGIITDVAGLRKSLRDYAALIEPWAKRVTERMHANVSSRDLRAWRDLSNSLSLGIRREIENAPTGQIQRELMAEQVALITSLPLKAAERVHMLTEEARLSGRRAADIAEEIAASGHVTIGRAKTIARTEVSRTATTLTQARAQYVGSEGYIWRTVGDSDVRPALNLPAKERANYVGSHRKLSGKFIRWDDPPVSGTGGQRAHAGQIFNCRCWPEPVIPEIV